MRRQQPLHQILQTVGFLDDDLRVFLERRIAEFPLQQLCRTAYAAQGILDLVGEVADQLAVGLLLHGLAFFANGLEMLVHGTKLKEEEPCTAGINRRYRAIQMQQRAHLAFACGRGHGNVVAGVAPVVAERLLKSIVEGRRRTREVRQLPAQPGALTDGKQILRCRIQVANEQAVIEQNDSGRQEVQPREKTGGLCCRIGGVHSL